MGMLAIVKIVFSGNIHLLSGCPSISPEIQTTIIRYNWRNYEGVEAYPPQNLCQGLKVRLSY
jgi:hypothetical protein